RELTVPLVASLLEAGGDVTAPGMHLFERTGAITGVVRDSAGSPWPNVTVRLTGTDYTARTEASGRFRLDSLPPGTFTLAVEDEGYQPFGGPATLSEIALDEGSVQNVAL